MSEVKTFPEAYAFPSTKDYCGLTKREYFAALALQGLLAGDPGMSFLEAANDAIDHADAFIEALNLKP